MLAPSSPPLGARSTDRSDFPPKPEWQRHTFTDGMESVKEEEMGDRYNNIIKHKHIGKHPLSYRSPLTAPCYIQTTLEDGWVTRLTWVC